MLVLILGNKELRSTTIYHSSFCQLGPLSSWPDATIVSSRHENLKFHVLCGRKKLEQFENHVSLMLIRISFATAIFQKWKWPIIWYSCKNSWTILLVIAFAEFSSNFVCFIVYWSILIRGLICFELPTTCIARYSHSWKIFRCSYFICSKQKQWMVFIPLNQRCKIITWVYRINELQSFLLLRPFAAENRLLITGFLPVRCDKKKSELVNTVQFY